MFHKFAILLRLLVLDIEDEDSQFEVHKAQLADSRNFMKVLRDVSQTLKIEF